MAEKKKAKLFPAKPTNVAANLMTLAETLTESEKKICHAAALDIEKAVSVLHDQADGRTEGVLEEVQNLNKKFEDAITDAQRQSKKQCIEFVSRHFASDGYASNTDLFRRLNFLLKDKHDMQISPYEVSDVHPLRRRSEPTIIVKFVDRKEGSAYHLLSSPWLLKKNDSRIELWMDVSLSPHDLNIRDALLWWRHRCTFMRANAALRGYNPDMVVPKSKWVMGVKTSATPGIVEAKFPDPTGRKKYKFDVVSTYGQLKNLMGPAAFDRYLLGGHSDRWDLPKRREKELDREKSRKSKGANSEKQSEQENVTGEGLRDDSIPESSEQIVPDEDAEEAERESMEVEEEEEDETTKSAKEAERLLRMETSQED